MGAQKILTLQLVSGYPLQPLQCWTKDKKQKNGSLKIPEAENNPTINIEE
jgi:hypothetical protein